MSRVRTKTSAAPTIVRLWPVKADMRHIQVAILIVHDIFGWTLPNARLLADHYAKEADATVYLPDL